MALSIPAYIADTGIVDAAINYKWTDPSKYSLSVPRLLNKIVGLESRSKLTLTLGFTEWVHWRLSKFHTQPCFSQFIEASWAAVVDRRYMNHMTKTYARATLKKYEMASNPAKLREQYQGDLDGDVKDPVRGPLLQSIFILGIVVDHTVPNDAFVEKTVKGSNVAEAVVGDIKAFKKWRRAVIKRLTDYHSSKPDNLLGSAVPRKILEPGFDYKPELAPELINDFLQGLDHEANPFLTSPEELKKIGFEGTPYVYEA